MSSYDRYGGSRQKVVTMSDYMRQQPYGILWIFVLLLVVGGVATSYYQVEPDEVGVVLRLGKHIGDSPPGPHFRLPFGIDRVTKVPVQRLLKQEFGFRTVRADVRSQIERGSGFLAESEMLTGDLNVGVVEWIVQYRIQDAAKYLFNFRDINATLHMMSEAAMRTVVGDYSIDEVITEGREEIEEQAKELLSRLCKRYDAGVLILQVKLQDANAPEPVRPALREVEEAKQERERMINDAWSVYNKAVPRAKGEAERSLSAAEGYAIERTNRARGDAERFNALEVEYRKAPEVTRTRLYLEMLADVLPKAERKVLVDPQAKGVLPLLNLGGDSGARRPVAARGTGAKQ